MSSALDVLLGIIALAAIVACVVIIMSTRRSSSPIGSAAPHLETSYTEAAELRARAEADAAETRRRAQEQADLLDEARHAHEA